MNPPFLLTTAGDRLPFPPANGSQFTLTELQLAVKGYISVVDLDHDLIMVLNDEGKLMGLPRNDLASLDGWIQERIWDWDHIVGDVVICPSSMID